MSKSCFCSVLLLWTNESQPSSVLLQTLVHTSLLEFWRASQPSSCTVKCVAARHLTPTPRTSMLIIRQPRLMLKDGAPFSSWCDPDFCCCVSSKPGVVVVEATNSADLAFGRFHMSYIWARTLNLVILEAWRPIMYILTRCRVLQQKQATFRSAPPIC